MRINPDTDSRIKISYCTLKVPLFWSVFKQNYVLQQKLLENCEIEEFNFIPHFYIKTDSVKLILYHIDFKK
jgi:hypothetical protein